MAEMLNLEQLKAKAESLIKSISGDKDLLASFSKDPVGTLEKKLGIDLPDEQINQLIEMIKKQLGSTATKGILAKIKSFFGKEDRRNKNRRPLGVFLPGRRFCYSA